MKFYFGLLALSAILLTSCNAPSIGEDGTQDADDITSEDILVVEEVTANYVNDIYGFSLTFPESWNGYEVQERALDWADMASTPSLDFGFEDGDESYTELFVSLMNISFFTAEEWTIVSKGMGPEKLGESNGLIIAGSGSQDAPEALRQQREDLEMIFASFQVNQ